MNTQKRMMRNCLFLFFSFSMAFSEFAQSQIDTIEICSFNIQFLGHFKSRDNYTLAKILTPYDIVVVQEMVAPPVNGIFPSDSTKFKADVESAAFVAEMEKQGYSYWLSSEDTGPTKNHTNSSASEWWITFYRSEIVIPDSTRYYGFLDTTLIASSLYERVPFCMPFKSVNGGSTFSLVSLHLKPGNSVANRMRRADELNSLFGWMKEQKEANEDFLLLGDCNIYKKEEFIEFESEFIYSLNRNCVSTNTKLYEDPKKGKPYDHVFYNDNTKQELITDSFKVVDLMKIVKNISVEGLIPYEFYEHNLFRTRFSDHLPVSFSYIIGIDKD